MKKAPQTTGRGTRAGYDEASPRKGDGFIPDGPQAYAINLTLDVTFPTGNTEENPHSYPQSKPKSRRKSAGEKPHRRN
jgi:hypothetical protein